MSYNELQLVFLTFDQYRFLDYNINRKKVRESQKMSKSKKLDGGDCCV